MLKYFNIEATKIACWINSSDFGAHEQNLIFIHGSGGDHSLWSLQYAKLHKHYNIVAIDLPGHGRSKGNGESDVGNYCFWIKRLLDILHLKNSILIGHSLGAAIALSLGITYPENLSGIVAVGGGLKMPVNAALLQALLTNPNEAIELICKFSLAKENREKFMAPLVKSLTQARIEVLYGDLSACDKMNLTEEIAKISVPALVICGAEDKMTPPDSSRQIAGGIGGAKLCLIEGAGHMVMMERPKEFNEALNKFVLSIS
ncbi:MAG: alpha/beta hydrolase [Smithellaceae bacterium]|jgi:pimeloyl-ACP methyl ester carboxylesterase